MLMCLSFAVAGGAAAQAVSTFTAGGVAFDMVHVPGGTCAVGATDDQRLDAFANERPAHTVAVADFLLATTEVTRELWAAVMGGECAADERRLPVAGVDWHECREFVARLNALTGQSFRLPDEAEWEFAARGGVGGHLYAGGDDAQAVAWCAPEAGGTAHAVATKQPNELGLYDMSGNLWEWCADGYDTYAATATALPAATGAPSVATGATPATTDKSAADAAYRVIRGGSWAGGAGDCRVSRRSLFAPAHRDPTVGLRLAMTVNRPKMQLIQDNNNN